jgi:hypothetical protein
MVDLREGATAGPLVAGGGRGDCTTEGDATGGSGATVRGAVEGVDEAEDDDVEGGGGFGAL